MAASDPPLSADELDEAEAIQRRFRFRPPAGGPPIRPATPTPHAPHATEATPDALPDAAGAAARVRAMTPRRLDRRSGSLAVPFDAAPGEPQLAPPAGADPELFTTRTSLPLAGLLATQAGVDQAKVLLYLEAGSAQRVSALGFREVPLVARLPDGRLAIIDGHHRLAAAKWAGATLATVDLYSGPVLVNP